MERDPYDDMGPDPTRDLIDLGPVEVAPDYHVEISVPFTSEQLEAVSKIVQEQGTSHSEVVQDLVAEALAARRTSR
jgi:acylphosphatase